MSEDKPQMSIERMGQVLLLIIELVVKHPEITDPDCVERVLLDSGITEEELFQLSEFLEPSIAPCTVDPLEHENAKEEVLHRKDICPNCAAGELELRMEDGGALLGGPLVCPRCKKEF